MASDHAAQVHGIPAAIEHLRSIAADQRQAYAAIFRLSCLDVVAERFGPQGAQDCLHSVAACLAAKLHPEDSLSLWKDQSLLAICERSIPEDLFCAELKRLLLSNRDFTIQIAERKIMLRIPMKLTVASASQFIATPQTQQALHDPSLDCPVSHEGPSR